MKIYNIYSKWLAYALQNEGFKLLSLGTNPHHPQFFVWGFEDTPELQSSIPRLAALHRKLGK